MGERGEELFFRHGANLICCCWFAFLPIFSALLIARKKSGKDEKRQAYTADPVRINILFWVEGGGLFWLRSLDGNFRILIVLYVLDVHVLGYVDSLEKQECLSTWSSFLRRSTEIHLYDQLKHYFKL